MIIKALTVSVVICFIANVSGAQNTTTEPKVESTNTYDGENLQEPSENVRTAMSFVKREDFLDNNQKKDADKDVPLEIGHGQTTSQPGLIADELTRLDIQPTDVILEVGTGNGYQTALLGKLAYAGEVCSVEIVPELQKKAVENFKLYGLTNITARLQNGLLPWGEGKMFTKIIVCAASKQVPKTLIDQLAPNGIMILPLCVEENSDSQMLVKVAKDADGNLTQTNLYPVKFVPLVEPDKSDCRAR
jgi:protein-L-isoaspartate(D-aspartate) O-methyltransferase